MMAARPAHPEPIRAAGDLRLGVDFHTFDGIYQGSRSHLLGLYRAAIEQAPDIDFLFFLDAPETLASAYPEFTQKNVELIRMPHRSGVMRLGWQLRALQRRHRLNYLHLQYRLPLLPAGACICTLHDVLFDSHPEYFSPNFVRMARWSTRHAIRHAAITLTVSDYSRTQIARHYGADADSIALTPNAVDRRRFHPGPKGAEMLARWGLEPGGYLCSLGRLEPRKNQVNLVEAYAGLPADTIPLIIIGQRDFAFEQVFETIRARGLTERVRILEDVDDRALPAVLRHARLMAYPSAAEGFGMPVLEALASGVPVVTSNTTSMPEIAGDAAWLIAPDDVDALRAAIAAALGESAVLRAARIERGLRHAERFNWHDAAATLLDAVRAGHQRGNARQ